jgi:hypothetical protein
MQAKRNDPTMAQRAIVFQILRDDHDERWSRAELEREVSDVEPLVVNDALALLEGTGVVDGEIVQASPCARHLDTLGLLSV